MPYLLLSLVTSTSAVTILLEHIMIICSFTIKVSVTTAISPSLAQTVVGTTAMALSLSFLSTFDINSYCANGSVESR